MRGRFDWGGKVIVFWNVGVIKAMCNYLHEEC